MIKLLNYLTLILVIITGILAYLGSINYINKSIVLTFCIISLAVYIISKKENDDTIYETIQNKKQNKNKTKMENKKEKIK